MFLEALLNILSNQDNRCFGMYTESDYLPVNFEPEITSFRIDRPGIRKVLGDLEAEIMEVMSSSCCTHNAISPTLPS